jgi:hypothetical protein
VRISIYFFIDTASTTPKQNKGRLLATPLAMTTLFYLCFFTLILPNYLRLQRDIQTILFPAVSQFFILFICIKK